MKLLLDPSIINYFNFNFYAFLYMFLFFARNPRKMLSPDCLQMMQNGMASPDLVEDDRKTNLIVNYLPQTMTQVIIDHLITLLSNKYLY